MENKIIITPAPGHVLVVQKKSTGAAIGGVAIAARENALHEGVVHAVGAIPPHFRMKLRVGDTITFARFNAVKGALPGEDHLFVALQHIVCKKKEVQDKLTRWQKIKGWFNFGWFSIAFASGWAANDVWAYVKPLFGKKR